jgi:fatty acid desaturase
VSQPLHITAREHSEVKRLLQTSVAPVAFVSATAIVATWAGIFIVLALCAWIGRWELAPVWLVLLGGLQHRFFTVYHEAFHRTLFGNARINDMAGRWLASYPALARYDSARAKHLGHHKYAVTPQDPDNVSYLRSWSDLLARTSPIFAILAVLGRFAGVTRPAAVLPTAAAENQGAHEIGELVCIAAVQLVLLGTFLAAGFGWWSLLYWVALLVVTPIFTSIRQWSEHFGGETEAEFVVTRPNFIERFLFSPMNFNLHEAHHRYPSISFPHLGPMQAELDKIGTGAIHRTSYIRPAIATLRLI